MKRISGSLEQTLEQFAAQVFAEIAEALPVCAASEGRVVNPRGTEPINVKSMFELLTSDGKDRFSTESVKRTPWTRRFLPGKALGPNGEEIGDLIEWTRRNWDNLVLKPERGYSGIGVRVGVVNPDADEAVGLALSKGEYIVQQKSLCTSGPKSVSPTTRTRGLSWNASRLISAAC